MEDLLLQIVKEASGSKFQHIKQAAQIAHDKLFRQHGIHRDHSYELRSVCFQSLQMAFETKKPKFITLALNGMHKIIRDERFSLGLEPEDDSIWLPAQLLRATSSLSTISNNEETVVNVLRLFLAVSCSPNCTLNGRLLIEILSKCSECWEHGSRAVRAASLAASSQSLRTFCGFLKDEVDDVLRNTPSGISNMSYAVAVYNEIIPVMQWLCSRLIEPINGSPKKPESNISLYLMECILTLTSSLPPDVHANPHFTAFLWQKFCPNLAATLGSPGRINFDKRFNYKDAIHLIENENRGFFTRPGLDGPQARCIYLTAVQILRIAGAQGSLRPMMEALFHRMLLLPSAQNRAEPLKSVREIFRSPQRLIDLSVILYPDKNQGQNCGDDMALFRLIIDAMEEIANAGPSAAESLQASVGCIVELLESLQILASGNFEESIISNQVTDVVNSRYSTLKESDYTGPLTYQSMSRLPAPYRDAVAELRQNIFETSSGSESEPEHHETEIKSTGSGDTEGPEEENHSSGDDAGADGSNWPWANHEECMSVRTDGDAVDRQHARDFVKILSTELVPNLLKLRSSLEVDESLQEFASNICQQNSMTYSDFDQNLTAINADGIYLATYSSLLLSLQLMRAGHYKNQDGSILIPLSEQQFVTSVQNCGVLVYLSSAWLRELYQNVLVTNALQSLQNSYDNSLNTHCALVDLLCDSSGIGATQFLSEWERLQSVAKIHKDISDHQFAAKKIARRLLTCSWESIVTVLSAGLGDSEAVVNSKLANLSKKTIRNNKQKNRKHGEALFALSLEGLHAAATLSNTLNLQHLAGKILNLIAKNVCQISGPKITASQALSMNVVLTGGLELGSYSADCWLPIFSVCQHVTQLEHDLFSSSQKSANVTNATSAPTTNKDNESPKKDKLNLSAFAVDEDETCVDVYSFLEAPLQSLNTNITAILSTYPVSNDDVVLTQGDTAKVLCVLAHQADNLFTDASERLNLPSLCQFLKYLCRASREQLYRDPNSKKGKKLWWPLPTTVSWKQNKKNNTIPLSLLLHRIGDATLKVFRGSRPLLHILKVWAITGPHLMDASCHKDRTISKRAIEYIHDTITSLLVEQSELPHFHFNEALLKPFENLLSMDNCDIDVQDQIVACLYEIVEAHRTEIRSGWRPLFGTLRTARNRPVHLSNITDIFRVFLDTDNMLVFANAGLDCILCLLSYLEVSGGGGCGGPIINAAGTTSPIPDIVDNNNIRSNDFLHEALKFLERCSSILDFMYNMPKCPNLLSTYKTKGITYTHIIDANIPNSMENFIYFGNDYLQNAYEQYMISYKALHIDKDSIIKIDELDKANGVLKVHFLLLDGLTNSLIVCPTAHQSAILQTIFKLFKKLHHEPGLEFGLYCINHLLIPMIQDWLRYINKTQKSWQSVEKNFKHCCGMLTDVVVDYMAMATTTSKPYATNKNLASSTSNSKSKFTPIQRPTDNLKFKQMKNTDKPPDADADASNISPSATLALKQLLLVLVECAAQPIESVARVAVSCLKHVIFSNGNIFNENQWMIICSAIHRATTCTMAPLKQLCLAFYENSESFYGDCATVKIAARRDTTPEELARINVLAQQVLLMDSQRDQLLTSKSPTIINTIPNDDRSYSFLLTPLGASGTTLYGDSYILRIPYRNLVIGLLANQLLLQLIANILLGRLKCVPSELHSCIYSCYTDKEKLEFDLGYRSKEILLRCLKQYLTNALELDSRPGLKFLIQKVSNLDFAPNLYKQLTSSFIINYMTLVDSYLQDLQVYNLSNEDVKFIIQSCSKTNSQLIKKKEYFVKNLFSLIDIWNMVCELYLSYHQQGQEEVEPTEYHGKSSVVPHIVENKLEEIDMRLELEVADGSEGPSSSNENENMSVNSDSAVDRPDENVSSVNTFVLNNQNYQSVRNNPFNVLPKINQTSPTSPNSPNAGGENQAISPEIEQQRQNSIQKDLVCKRAALTQLVIASMELLRLLPESGSNKLKLLLNPTIKDAFRSVQLQSMDKVHQLSV